jgi:uncharacterized protein YjgD (DUF1641 family)
MIYNKIMVFKMLLKIVEKCDEFYKISDLVDSLKKNKEIDEIRSNIYL